MFRGCYDLKVGASAFEFRFRMPINAAIVVLGFWAPWIEGLGIGKRISLLEWLALEVSRTSLLGFTAASAAAIVLASLLAGAGAGLRVWGTAYLGPGVVTAAEMRAGTVMAGGPYRHVRNPLYLGVWLMAAALSFTMPVTGALAAMALLTLFLLRLIAGEERYLTTQLGEAYQVYRRAAPRLFPRIRTNLPTAAGSGLGWGRAVMSELNPMGVFLIVAALSWKYDNRLMIRAFLVSFGVSLVARALVPAVRQETR